MVTFSIERSKKMKRLTLLSLLFLLGCSSYTKILITEPQARAINLQFAGEITSDTDGNVYLLSPVNVVRYSPGAHSAEELLLERHYDLVDIAMTDDGLLLVLRQYSLEAFFGGKLIKLLSLPGRGIQLSVFEDQAYILLLKQPHLQLIRYSFSSKKTEILLNTSDYIWSICALRGGCLIASGDSVYKIFDPADGEERGEKGNLRGVRLFALAHSQIRSIAADRDYEIIYLADAEMTYGWVEGKVVPLFPMGYKLSFAGDILTICSPQQKQMIQIVRPGKRALQMLRGTGK